MTEVNKMPETIPKSISNLISGVSAPANELKRLMSVIAPSGSSALILGPNWIRKGVSIKRNTCSFGKKRTIDFGKLCSNTNRIIRK